MDRQLWLHQKYAIDTGIQKIESGVRSFCITSPTGGGKSTIVQGLCEYAASVDKRVALFTNRRLLTNQLAKGLSSAGIHLGVRAAEFESWTDLNAPVQICSTPTEVARVINRRKKAIDRLMSEDEAHSTYTLFPAEVVIVDEAHLNASERMQQIIKEYREKHDSTIIGVTATPLGISHLYSELIVAGNMTSLRQCGALVPARCFQPTVWDLSKVYRAKHELPSQDAMEAATRAIWTQHVVGSIYTHWKKINADGKATIAFAPGVKESMGMAQEFHSHGVTSAHISGEGMWVNGKEYKGAKQEDRDEVFAMSKAGEIQVIWNRFVLREAIDLPWLECLILACPIGSLLSYIQTCGRILRASPSTGKTNCIAEGTLVLTSRGLVPIEQVKIEDKLWDGTGWVSHKGVEYRGCKQVISYAGITATPDHRVWTDQGWRSLVDCRRLRLRVAQTGHCGHPIRVGESYISGYQSEKLKESQEGVCACEMPDVSCRGVGSSRQPTSRQNNGVSGVQSTKEVSSLAMEQGLWCPPAVHKSQRRVVVSVRWPRNKVRVFFGGGMLPMGNRQSWVRWGRETSTGSDRQRWKLRTRKYSVVNSGSKHGAHKSIQVVSEISQNKAGTPRSDVCGFDSSQFSVDVLDRRDSREMAQAVVQAKRKVWDILEAGPLHRFTAAGILVHNCTIIDHAGSIELHGSPNMDRDQQWIQYFHEDSDKITKDRVNALRDPENQEPTAITCPKCGAMRKSGPKCINPACGFEHSESVRYILQEHGELVATKESFMPKRKPKMKADTAKLWERCYWRCKNAKTPKSFNQVRALFIREHGYSPPQGLPLMPKSSMDWSRKIPDVSYADLIHKPK